MYIHSQGFVFTKLSLSDFALFDKIKLINVENLRRVDLTKTQYLEDFPSVK